jgi:endonuclease/exonuclease/phosphatase family metal-dependent hydrolase
VSTRRFGGAALAVLAGVACLTAATPADAATPWPTKPTGVRVVAISRTSFTVTTHRATHAARYAVVASRVKSDVYYVNLTRHRPNRATVTSTRRTITVRGLKYTTAPYFYRMQARNGSHLQVSSIREVHLRPPRPTHLAVSRPGGLSLTWSSAPATTFVVMQATDRYFRQNRRTYFLDGHATQFTPYGLSRGRTSYFRIRARSGPTVSAYSRSVSAVATAREQAVTVMTYNVSHKQFDGVRQGSGVVAPWSRRMPVVKTLIMRGNPDVISVQEANDWVRRPTTRQIDTLARALRGSYALATTEKLPNPRTGNYILYKRASYAAYGAGGHWQLGHLRWAAYQVLRDKRTGARFLLVAVHLKNGSPSMNNERALETRKLLADARRRAGGLPIVYAGDFNSYTWPGRTYDAPERLMRSAHVADALVVAQSRKNTRYSSYNGYFRVASTAGGCIDHIFAEPGVALRIWSQLLDVRHGRFLGVIPSDHNPILAGITIPY